MDQKSIKDTYKKYLENTFFEKRGGPLSSSTETEPPLLVNGIEAAMKSLRKGRAPGSDGMPIEFIQLFDKESIKMLCKVFNNIYDTGNTKKEWLSSGFILLPKNNQFNETFTEAFSQNYPSRNIQAMQRHSMAS
ncbi:hypothetical protein Trydic_g8104 [Trypoxylus dichotomus]